MTQATRLRRSAMSNLALALLAVSMLTATAMAFTDAGVQPPGHDEPVVVELPGGQPQPSDAAARFIEAKLDRLDTDGEHIWLVAARARARELRLRFYQHKADTIDDLLQDDRWWR